METKECTETLGLLEKLGFTRAHKQATELQKRKRKLALAYEHYRFVRQEHVDQFNQKLKEKTIKNPRGLNESYQRLDFTPVDVWAKVPPTEVLKAMEEAVDRQCFDFFEVAHIQEVKDPIIFGRIHGCPDRFYIAQWENDVTIEQLILPNEG